MDDAKFPLIFGMARIVSDEELAAMEGVETVLARREVEALERIAAALERMSPAPIGEPSQ